MARERDQLSPVGEVGGEPVKCSALNTLLTQPLKEDGMVGPQQDAEGTGVCRGEEIVSDFDQGSFGAVKWAKARLGRGCHNPAPRLWQIRHRTIDGN